MIARDRRRPPRPPKETKGWRWAILRTVYGLYMVIGIPAIMAVLAFPIPVLLWLYGSTRPSSMPSDPWVR